MVVSHHPPTQYERTLHVGRVRLCARCVGLLLGAALGIPLSSSASTTAIPAGHLLLLVIELGVLGFGITAFVLHEAGRRASSNYERTTFGLALGALLPFAWKYGRWPFLAFLVLIVAGQFLSALLLRRLGVLKRFVAEYLEGAEVDPQAKQLTVDRCGRLFCGCSSQTRNGAP